MLKLMTKKKATAEDVVLHYGNPPLLPTHASVSRIQVEEGTTLGNKDISSKFQQYNPSKLELPVFNGDNP